MWMNIYKPIIGELTEENDIHASIELYKENGTIRIELPEDDKTDTYAYYVTASGKVKITEKGKV